MNPFMRSEVLVVIAEERLALGDRDQAHALFRNAVTAIQPQKDILKSLALAAHRTQDEQGRRSNGSS